ncbi:rhophilin-1 isoform X2 [Takifugu flavidus]|uniref:Rhophilin-1 GTP-Rho-binding protein 1 n=1 Tax=Takifugu flavidus TaxID=433684 RepID=A0A5C6MTN0_9TELE|nr:rhophilin-1 isoform X2 [Takifugu flavidus]TWW58426.1 Rhophilin-1 GTP-Rho-binding protein 1 [Takifugu flavidus]
MMEEPATRDLDMALSDGASDDETPPSLPADGGSVRKGCDPLAQTQRSKLQHRRARINQQINKEMRMRAGAENLFRATSNNKVKETVALELSFVNSNLQLLKEELEELNSNMEAYQTDSETINVPMIPLGLKETKEVDFTLPIQDFICEHYGEDSSAYNQEIKELMELRQAMRTPSRNQAGLELLMEYYNQLYYLDQRFFPLHRTLGVLFHWYDSLTGVPSSQRTLAFEKGSVLFNVGALYTQIGARQDRSAVAGIDRAVDAFQRAAGAFNYLKENFSNAPSLDMSSPSLCMLVRLMVAQVQECVFERLTLTTADTHFTSQLRLAQEAARVSDVYVLVQQTMTQPLMKDYVPFSWASMVQVKSEHFAALSHFYAAAALCDHTLCAEQEEQQEQEEQEQEQEQEDSQESEEAFLHFYINVPAGPSLSQILQDPEKRRRLGKAHLRRAVIRHEEAMRVHSLCKVLRKMDILQDVLALTHRRSLDKYSELDREDDFDETAEAPEIQSLTHQKPEITPPDFSTVQVTDIFQKLGPLSVFCARARWGPVHVIGLRRREGGLGLTLRGDSPVLVAGVVPGGCAAEAGLREGDYIVAVDGQDCKWAKHAEVVHLLKSCGDRGVELSVVTLHSHDTQAERRAAMLSHNKDKENTRQHFLDGAKGQSSASLLNWNRKKKRDGGSGTKRLASTFSLPFGSIRDAEVMY